MIYSNSSISKLFPKKWRGVLTAEDVEDILCIDRKIAIQKTQSLLGHPKWNGNKLKRLIKTKGKPWNEDWRLPEEDRYLLVWQNNCSFVSSPHAIMSFKIEITEKTKSNKASRIFVTNNLMWVDPEYRRKGLGYHLTAQFIAYLQECKIYYPFVSRLGVDIEYYAEFFSIGGECLSNRILDYLEYMRESKLFWSIKNIEADVGF